MPFFALLVAAISIHSSPVDVRVVNLRDSGPAVEATIITVPKEENRGFAVLDVPEKVEGEDIRAHWDPARHLLMVNGGYFEADFSPTGYNRVDGQIVNETPSPRLSGFVALDEQGKLSLLTRQDQLEAYPTVLQSGPYVIDPGGRIGIKTPSSRIAKRTLVGMTNADDVVLVITDPISLFDLAIAVKRKMPTIERLLNLDGGPSTALKTADHEVVNTWPVRNYLLKRKAPARSIPQGIE